MTYRHRLALLAALSLAGCTSESISVQPGELELRDLLGLAPDIGAAWTESERAEARALLFGHPPGLVDVEPVPLGVHPERARAVVWSLTALDDELARAGRDPALLVRVEVAAGEAWIAPRPLPDPTPSDAASPRVELVGWERAADDGWAELAVRAPDFLAELARAAGHDGDVVRVAPAAREPFAAAYVAGDGLLLVNPIVLAALEPRPAGELPLVAADPADRPVAPPPPPDLPPVARGPNPYSFFGSVAECAAAERLRCEDCLPSSSCEQESRDAVDGNAECETLAADNGRGYYLFCVNLSLAIATVDDCVADEGAQCPRVTTASNQLAALDANAIFLDDPACGDALDACLGRIYGESDEDFPPPPSDAGPAPPPPPPPRDLDVSCGEQSCDFSPDCSASCGSGGCDNSASCDGCGSSEGCGGGGGGGGGGSSCDSSCGGSGGGDGGDDSCQAGGCDCGGGDDDGGGMDDGGGCDCGGDDGDGGGGGDGGGCDGGCGGGGSEGGGGCDGGCGSGGGGGGSSCGGSGSGSGNCSAAGRRVRARWTTAVAVLWAMVPLGVLGALLRRERRRDEEEGDACDGI